VSFVIHLTRALASVALVAMAGRDAREPYDIPLEATAKAPSASGHARLVFAASPFGVAVTPDGRASYDIQIAITGLPDPSTLGAFRAYVAWTASTDLASWRRLGVVRNGSNTVGRAELNKFLLVISAEADSGVTTHAGPTVLHGVSPSTWLQSFLSHPLFRGIPP
jgi:hypothetical protein